MPIVERLVMPAGYGDTVTTQQWAGMEFDSNSYSDPVALHPKRVVAWSSFPTDATRLVFDA